MKNWVFETYVDNYIYHLKSLSRRIKSFANENAVPDKSNKLWITWSNIKLMLDKNDTNYYSEVMYFSTVMSIKIEEYSKTNILNGDPTISCILYELNKIKPCDYEILEG